MVNLLSSFHEHTQIHKSYYPAKTHKSNFFMILLKILFRAILFGGANRFGEVFEAGAKLAGPVAERWALTGRATCPDYPDNAAMLPSDTYFCSR